MTGAQPEADVNLGLRWETTLPPYRRTGPVERFLADRAESRAPTIAWALSSMPAPARAAREAALWRIPGSAGSVRASGSRTASNDKTVIRANFARSFSQVTTTTGSTHQKGFTQTIGFGTAQRALARRSC